MEKNKELNPMDIQINYLCDTIRNLQLQLSQVLARNYFLEKELKKLKSEK